MLYVDKYRPKTLSRLECHQELSVRLKNIVSKGNFPHLLFHGPSGSGKKTRIYALLREIFGNKVENIKLQNKDITFGKSKKTITITTLQSQYHIEVTPSDSGNNDRHVVTKLLKDIAQSIPVNIDPNKKKRFKVVVLNEVDTLTHQAQAALRRTMEKYTSNCKLILNCTSSSGVLSPIKSRCLCIRVPAPTDDEIKKILFDIAKKENLKLNNTMAMKILENAGGNMRRAILNFEAAVVENYPFKDGQNPPAIQWESFINEIANDILEKQTPKRLLEIRAKFYTLITNCIPGSLIMEKLVQSLIEKKVDEEVKHLIVQWGAIFEDRMQKGTKPIFHLEAFTAKIMFLYKKNQMEKI